MRMIIQDLHRLGEEDRSLVNMTEELQEKVKRHMINIREKLSGWLSRRSSAIWMKELNHNRYSIPDIPLLNAQPPSREYLCAVPLRTIAKEDNLLLNLQLSKYLVEESFLLTSWKKFKNRDTCAIVSSSGALKDSNLGNEINSHDIVFRFNDAPTDGYEEDVGNKTSIRILNSQVLARKDFSIKNPLYRNSINLVWDPSNYSVDLLQWSSQPDHYFFSNFIESRNKEPEVPFFIIHPQFLWDLWDQIQSSFPKKIMRTPPSSGFIGLMLAMKLCAYVDFYEYVPSIRMSERCHYYDNSSGFGCTLGDWHPLAAEKLFALRLNRASDREIAIKGKIRVTGCD